MAAKQLHRPTSPVRARQDTNSVQKVPRYPLSQLLLDSTNARLGRQHQPDAKQAQVLDTIVEVFGVDDVLSSIAVNGYFDEEPLVGIHEKNSSKIRIKEGNRRLAACLILAGDPRARNQSKRTSEYQALQAKYKKLPITEVPVLVHDNAIDLLPYLGVRHIAAAQPWDSFAKAAWVADVLETSKLRLEDVSQMIGDQHRTVARILEGYYLISQLIESGQFTPSQSLRPGRGSNPEYPFSWVYTALGYKPIRNWLGLGDLAEGHEEKPMKASKLDDAGELMVFLFGNKAKKRQPAISDSREISDLAKAVADPERRQLLKRGKTVDDVAMLAKPPKERIGDALFDAQESLEPVLLFLTGTSISPDDASELTKPSQRVKKLASQVHVKLQEAARSETEGDDEQDAR